MIKTIYNVARSREHVKRVSFAPRGELAFVGGSVDPIRYVNEGEAFRVLTAPVSKALGVNVKVDACRATGYNAFTGSGF